VIRQKKRAERVISFCSFFVNARARHCERSEAIQTITPFYKSAKTNSFVFFSSWIATPTSWLMVAVVDFYFMDLEEIGSHVKNLIMSSNLCEKGCKKI